MSSATVALRGFRQMTKDPLQGGFATYGGVTYDCAIGTFEIRQMLIEGGFSNLMLGDIQLAADDLPDGTKFKSGQNVTVTRNTGQVHQCQIFSVSTLGVLLHLTLRDLSEGA
jgi:hypothetical protein